MAMPHAASLQSFLDTCSQGHFDNSSAWLPLHAHCRHVVPQEHAGRHIAPSDPGAASCFPRSHKPLWLHVVGDSTMRFFYAGLLSYFNGTERRAPGFPLHWLPSNDSCAFAKTGWPTTHNNCYRRWRGKCDESQANGCFLDARGLDWRVTFSWWHTNKNATRIQALKLPWRNESSGEPISADRPVAVLVGLGVWEALWTTKTNTAPSKVYAERVSSGLTAVARMREELGGGSAVFLFGNGACRFHQRLPFVRRVTGPKADFPGASYEAQVVGRGNALLDAYARNQSGGGPVLYVNRSAPIAGAAAVAGAPAMIESPCFHSHPYGALTDVSVCLVLRAVQGLAHGPETR